MQSVYSTAPTDWADSYSGGGRSVACAVICVCFWEVKENLNEKVKEVIIEIFSK